MTKFKSVNAIVRAVFSRGNQYLFSISRKSVHHVSFRDYEMNSECQRFLPTGRRVSRMTVDHYIKYTGTLQSMSEVQRRDTVFTYDREVIAIIAACDGVFDVLTLKKEKLIDVCLLVKLLDFQIYI